MKLRNYQIDAIVDEIRSKIEEIRDIKKNAMILSSRDKKLLDMHRKYKEAHRKSINVENEECHIKEEFNDAVRKVYPSLTLSYFLKTEDVESQIKNSHLDNKYGKMPSDAEIRRKVILNDISTDFNIEDIISGFTEIYK